MSSIISFFLSLRGGILIGITLILKYKSERNLFLSISFFKSLLVAVINLKSILIGVVPPTRVTVLSCNVFNNFTCRVNGISAISSKNKVPLWANSISPILPSSLAPVNAPFSYPNSSDSIRFSGIAPQFISINGPHFFRLLYEYSWQLSFSLHQFHL